MSNSTEIQVQYPNNIIAPHPRRSHSTPSHYHHHYHNSHRPIKLNKLHPFHHTKPTIKLSQDPGPDEVLSEFLSLFNPSEPIQSIPIFINPDPDTLTESPTRTDSTEPLFSPNTPLNTHLDPSNPANTILPHQTTSSSPPLDSIKSNPSSFSSLSISPRLSLDQPHVHHHQNHQLGLTIIPNHLSTIVSSPISRCHNPLPRHAELDALACRIAQPFKSLYLNPQSDHRDDQEEQGEQDIHPRMSEKYEVQCDDDSPSEPILLSNLDHAFTTNSTIS